ncbi:MAG: NAD(P) transhydrogenase [Planctomycetota bacterium]|jgi:NAD(P) transhydrogenase
MDNCLQRDVVVIGGGPAGQKAAMQAAKEGRSVMIVDRIQELGGECVQRGTIPSKTLRETAVTLTALKSRTEGVLQVDLGEDLKVTSLMKRLRSVLAGHQDYMRQQIDRNGIEVFNGKARISGPKEVTVEKPGGGSLVVHSDLIVIATGSRPRSPDFLEIDHDHILDSDSILSIIYLPKSLTVLGGGVIACEFATIMTALGVDVTIVDRHDKPMGFLDSELTDRFLAAFERSGGTFMGNRNPTSVVFDGVSSVEVRFEDGACLRSERVLCALGRQACIAGLGLEDVGVEITDRGYVGVDENFVTSVEGILAVGDVVGPPGLAATAMDQGQRAMRHALGLPLPRSGALVPLGIYTIPEMGGIGQTEAEARKEHGEILIGRAFFHELARGQITGNTEGLLKLVFDARGERLLGAHIVGEGATEIIHVAQMAMHGNMGLDDFLENTFNFPTLGEAYRVAAIDAHGKLAKRQDKAAKEAA